jgi:NAD(P)-dependent dehydrogenase (short-subunit alcohol dehydrogenase family)
VLAEAFSAEGAKLVGCDTDVDGGRATAASAQAAGGEMIFVGADVTNDHLRQGPRRQPVQTYRGLDCGVNNAGTEATGLIAIFDVLIVRRRVRTRCDCPDERRPSMKGLRLGRKKPEPAEKTKPSRLSRKKPEPAEKTKPSRLSRKKPESKGR